MHACTRRCARRMGDLPAARLNRTARAFVHISVDYIRSLSGRLPVESINRLHRFIYHIPHDQSSTLRARQRLYLSYLYRSVSMLSRRGLPTSNNGTTFHGADREFQCTCESNSRS